MKHGTDPRRVTSRRRILELTLGVAATSLLVSCGAPSTPAPSKPAAQPTAVPAKPTAAAATKPAPAATSAPAPTTAPAKAAPKEREKVIMQLEWFPVSYHTPFYVAVDKGWYAEQGLDVELREGKGSGQVAQLVGAGQATLGHIEGGAMVKAIGAGAPLKSVALAFAKTPLGFAYAKDVISTPKDMEGKTYGAVPFTASHQFWPAFAEINKIDATKVTIVNIDPVAYTQLMATKKVDFVDAAAGENDYLVTEAGRPTGTFLLSDYGLKFVGHAIATTPTILQQKPDMVRRFVDATLRAYDFTKTNDKEALDIFLKKNPEVKRGLAENQLKASSVLWSNPSGAQTEEQWKNTLDLVLKAVKLDKEPKASDLFTNDFLPKR